MENPEKIIRENQTVWKLNGKLHKEDGPAVINADDSIAYYKHGELHSLKGPAMIWYALVHTGFKGGVKVKYQRWFIDGKEYSEREWKIKSGNETKLEYYSRKIREKFRVRK